MMEPYYHAMTVAKLRELLSTLDEEMIVVPNTVKNLAVARIWPDGYEYLGFIDFGFETLEVEQVANPEPPK